MCTCMGIAGVPILAVVIHRVSSCVLDQWGAFFINRDALLAAKVKRAQPHHAAVSLKKMVSRAARAKPNEWRPPYMAGLERGVISPCELEISFSTLFVNQCVMWPSLRAAFPRGALTLELRHQTRAVVIKTGSQSADYERVFWSPSIPAPLEAGGTAGAVLIDQFLGNLG